MVSFNFKFTDLNIEEVKFCAGAQAQSAGGISVLSLFVIRTLRQTMALEKSKTFPPCLAGMLKRITSTSFTPKIMNE